VASIGVDGIVDVERGEIVGVVVVNMAEVVAAAADSAKACSICP
jgi:hypothetical protein